MVARIRLLILLAILAAIWAYAIATDHSAPAWGMSRLPALVLENFFLVLLSLAAIVTYCAVRKFRESKSNDGSVA